LIPVTIINEHASLKLTLTDTKDTFFKVSDLLS